MTLSQLLNSEAGLTLVGGAVGLAWAAFRSSEYCERLKTRRYDRAVEALEAGVESTYRTYVRAIKEARADGKLTDAEIAEAHQRACAAAVAFGKSRGIDVLREIGAEYADLWIAKLVTRLKRA